MMFNIGLYLGSEGGGGVETDAGNADCNDYGDEEVDNLIASLDYDLFSSQQSQQSQEDDDVNSKEEQEEQEVKEYGFSRGTLRNLQVEMEKLLDVDCDSPTY